MVFIDVTATEYGEGGFEGGKVKRGDLEIAAASWLAANSPDGEIQVRFDIIDMLVVSADRALLRHHINAFSCGVEQPTSIPAPAGGPGAPRGHPEGLFPRLPAVPHDSLVGRERHGAQPSSLFSDLAHSCAIGSSMRPLSSLAASADPVFSKASNSRASLPGVSLA